MAEFHKYDVVILGGGPAGLTAAIYAARAGSRVVLIENAACGGQMLLAHEIENYPGFSKISGMDLADAMVAQASQYGVETLYGNVTDLREDKGRFIFTVESRAIEADAMILATGTRRRLLGVPGEEEFSGRGVSYCAVCDGRFFKGRDVAVVGGGNTALGDALYLAQICPRVTLIHRRDSFRADKILVDRVKNTPNIRILTQAKVLSIVGDTALRALIVSREDAGEMHEETVPVSGCFVAVGSNPNTDVTLSLSGVRYDTAGYILTDDACSTDCPGLFAAGDVRSKELRQIATAVSDGAIAGTEAANYVSAKRN